MNIVHPAEGLHLQTQNSGVAGLGQMSLTLEAKGRTDHLESSCRLTYIG